MAPRRPPDPNRHGPAKFEGQCTAQSKQTGNRCERPAMHGRLVCYHHGGKGGRPPVHGRWSRSFGRLRESYEEARADGELMDMSRTLAVLDVNVQRAAERVEERDTPEFRRRAAKLYMDAQDASASGDQEKAAQKLAELGVLLRAGVSADRAFAKLVDAAERFGRSQESAWRVRLSKANAINAMDVRAILARFLDFVTQEAPVDVAARIIDRIDVELGGARQDVQQIAEEIE